MGDLDPASPGAGIDLTFEPEFDLGGMRVRPAERSVEMDGRRRELQPRVMKVLVALAQAKSAVVSRDTLIERCWDGRIVGDDAINRCILVLRQLAQEFTSEPFTIETLPRVGHRLFDRPVESPGSAAQPVKVLTWRLWGLLAAVLLAAAAAGFYVWQQRAAALGPAAIAVLPFRNLSSGDPYFAEGVGEEILTRLAQEPDFRVAGRSSAEQYRKATDPREVGRALGVDYILEGSVRSDRGGVRVNASLVRTGDGIQIWSDTYDGKLDDIFAIQQQVGGSVAGALKRKLVRTPVLSGPLVTNGEAYNLYLTARGLIRMRRPQVGRTAANLLRDAIKIDPGYAPAWASLAVATHQDAASIGHENVVASIPKAQTFARQALRLAPDLAEAHRALATVRGHGDPDGQLHFRRAAELDPNNAENVIGLGVALGASGEFDQALAAYRRAAELDPLWFRTTAAPAIAIAEMGNRAEAEAIARRGFAGNQVQQHVLLGRIAWIVGDFSEAARYWSIVARANSPRWSDVARRNMISATFTVGLKAEPVAAIPPPFSERSFERVWMDAPPTPAVWQARNRDAIAAETYRAENLVAAKLMLNAGRSRELAATYDSPVGLLGIRPGQSPRVDQLNAVPVVALVLLQTNRAADADRLLREADSAIRRVYRRSRVPFWFDAEAAAVWAVQGRTQEALTALERAIRRGWANAGRTDLRGIASEPAFRSLRGPPRFERIVSSLEAHYAREREEILRLKI